MDKRMQDKLIALMSANLPLLRSRLSISQEELSSLLGVTRQTITSLESGQRKMTWSVFLALILIFFRNEPTKRLIVALEIYTPELNDFLNISNRKSAKQEE